MVKEIKNESARTRSLCDERNTMIAFLPARVPFVGLARILGEPYNSLRDEVLFCDRECGNMGQILPLLIAKST